MRSRFFILVFMLFSFISFSNKVYARFDNSYSMNFTSANFNYGSNKPQKKYDTLFSVGSSGAKLTMFDGDANYKEFNVEEFDFEKYPYWLAYTVDESYFYPEENISSFVFIFSKTPIYLKLVQGSDERYSTVVWCNETGDNFNGNRDPNDNILIYYFDGSVTYSNFSFKEESLNTHNDVISHVDMLDKNRLISGKGNGNYFDAKLFATNDVIYDFQTKKPLVSDYDTVNQLKYNFDVKLDHVELDDNKKVLYYAFKLELDNHNDFYITAHYDDDDIGSVSFDGIKDFSDYLFKVDVNCKITFHLVKRDTGEIPEIRTFEVENIGMYFDEDAQKYVEELNNYRNPTDDVVNDYVEKFKDEEWNEDSDDTNHSLNLFNYIKDRFPIIEQLYEIHGAWKFDINNPKYLQTKYGGCTTIGYVYEVGGEQVYSKKPYCNQIPRMSLKLGGVQILNNLEVVDTYWFWKYRDEAFFLIRLSLGSFTFFKLLQMIRSCI